MAAPFYADAKAGRARNPLWHYNFIFIHLLLKILSHYKEKKNTCESRVIILTKHAPSVQPALETGRACGLISHPVKVDGACCLLEPGL
jgi:hypothetical protein